MILLRIALRNVFATRVRTALIGMLVTFGTALVILGGSLLSSLDESMRTSVVGSVSGDLQIYSADAKDKLDLFAPPTGRPDLGRIKDFPRVKAALQALPFVKAVVPMGTDVAMVFSGNIVDLTVGSWWDAWKRGDREKALAVRDHLHQIVQLLRQQISQVGDLVKESGRGDYEQDWRRLNEVAAEEFWAHFDDDPEANADKVEAYAAPMAMDAQMMFFSYMGTDTEAFRSNFRMFEIVKGTAIPPGQRGFLFADFTYEEQVKHAVARRLDMIREKRDIGIRIALDETLHNLVRQNVRQYKDIVFQLDRPATAAVTAAVQRSLGTDETDLPALLQRFLDMDDSSFDARYAVFYADIAPHLLLYRMKVGDILTLRTYASGGYATSVNVKVYGTFRFRGLEKSALAGSYCLMDMMTFRDLYGYVNKEKREEIQEIKKEVGAKRIAREDAEAALFGGDAAVEEKVEARGFDEFAGVQLGSGGKRFTQELLNEVYTQEQIDDGVVLSAAVVLADGSRVDEARAAIERLSKEQGLGIQTIGWREASGMVGQFIFVVWVLLVSAIFVIFLVALVIINNSMTMATLDRTQEIGTMRALGAQRVYIYRMFFIESSVLAVGFGLVGVGLGSGVVLLLNAVGIPAWSDILYFLFAGPRLHPVLFPSHLVVAFGVVLIVSVLSAVYPARLAARIPPAKAMGKED